MLKWYASANVYDQCSSSGFHLWNKHFVLCYRYPHLLYCCCIQKYYHGTLHGSTSSWSLFDRDVDDSRYYYAVGFCSAFLLLNTLLVFVNLLCCIISGRNCVNSAAASKYRLVCVILKCCFFSLIFRLDSFFFRYCFTFLVRFIVFMPFRFFLFLFCIHCTSIYFF